MVRMLQTAGGPSFSSSGSGSGSGSSFNDVNEKKSNDYNAMSIVLAIQSVLFFVAMLIIVIFLGVVMGNRSVKYSEDEMTARDKN